MAFFNVLANFLFIFYTFKYFYPLEVLDLIIYKSNSFQSDKKCYICRTL